MFCLQRILFLVGVCFKYSYYLFLIFIILNVFCLCFYFLYFFISFFELVFVSQKMDDSIYLLLIIVFLAKNEFLLFTCPSNLLVRKANLSPKEMRLLNNLKNIFLKIIVASQHWDIFSFLLVRPLNLWRYIIIFYLLLLDDNSGAICSEKET